MGSGDVPARELRSPVIIIFYCALCVCVRVCVCTRARPRMTKQEGPRPANLPRMGLAAAFKVVEAMVVAAGVVLAMLLCMPVCHLYPCVDNDLLRIHVNSTRPNTHPRRLTRCECPAGYTHARHLKAKAVLVGRVVRPVD